MSGTEAVLILASGSRFRRVMLVNAGVVFRVVPADVDEPAARAAMQRETAAMAPETVAMRLAELKALEVSARHPQALVIGADQVLALDGEIFGKPVDTHQGEGSLAIFGRDLPDLFAVCSERGVARGA